MRYFHIISIHVRRIKLDYVNGTYIRMTHIRDILTQVVT